ncbi:cobalamin 5'-phosphate synthase [Gammaproteobacteria bacterium 45_16_T64]|nr:cobalamin 5'-phosphate synthase [Gammaproteobacteria bacterium 45_16_T64]
MGKSFCFALLFLTRIPVPQKWQHYDSHTQSQSIYWHPVIGAIIGAILFGSYQLLQLTGLANHIFPVSALLLLLWILITGGLHLDGLGDSADGWLGGYGDKDRTLAIMKDSHSGAAAVIAITSVLLLKVVALAAVISTAPYWLLLVPAFARLNSIILFATTPYARSEGLGSPFASGLNLPLIGLLCGLMAIILWLAGGITGLSLLFGGAILTALLRRQMIRRIDGTTGDTAGATIEIIEAFSFIFILLIP